MNSDELHELGLWIHLFSDYFDLDHYGRCQAQESAAMRPAAALRCYRAIGASFGIHRPWISGAAGSITLRASRPISLR